MASINLIMVVQSSFCQWYFTINHTFSIGLRSGEFPGHSKTFTFCFMKNSFTFFDSRHGARSCWNIPPPSRKVTLMCVMIFLWITSMYLPEFIIPSTGTSVPTPQKLKQSRNIFFGVCFDTWLKWPGLSFSPSLISGVTREGARRYTCPGRSTLGTPNWGQNVTY